MRGTDSPRFVHGVVLHRVTNGDDNRSHPVTPQAQPPVRSEPQMSGLGGDTRTGLPPPPGQVPVKSGRCVSLEASELLPEGGCPRLTGRVILTL